MSHNLFNTLQTFDLGNGKSGQFYSLPALEAATVCKCSNRQSSRGLFRMAANSFSALLIL